jgi:hypothetical protein
MYVERSTYQNIVTAKRLPPIIAAVRKLLGSTSIFQDLVNAILKIEINRRLVASTGARIFLVPGRWVFHIRPDLFRRMTLGRVSGMVNMRTSVTAAIQIKTQNVQRHVFFRSRNSEMMGP